RNVINGEIVSFISDHKQEFITALHRPREVNGLNSFFYCPASTAQKRMYAAQLMDPGSNAYNVSDVVKFNHRIDHVRLKNALNEIVGRHESLRTSFAVVNDSIVQKVHVRLELEVERKAVDT